MPGPEGCPEASGRRRPDPLASVGMDTRVWIDDPNPIYRMGLACCLRRGGFVLVGESTDFVPRPDLERTDILVFDLGEQTLGWALGRAGASRPARLLGLVGPGGPDRDLTRGVCTVLVRSELTPDIFVDCLRSLASLCGPGPEAPASRRRVMGFVDRLARPGARGVPRRSVRDGVI